jgi:murein DD-endopeptidase MepM/ murein hydrolase activator NlpD
MAKAFLCLFFIVLSIHTSNASEKAFNVLMINGFKAEELVTLVKKYPELKDLDVAFANTITTDPLNHLKLYAEKTNDLYLITKNTDTIDVEKTEIQYETVIKGESGTIHNNLYDSIMHDLRSASVASQIHDAFKDEFSNTKGMRVNALYDFQVEQYYDQGKFIKYGKVLSASLIIGKALSKKIYQLNTDTFSWELLPENIFRNDKPFYLPVDSVRVSSLFQLDRRHPVTKKHQPHKGIDFASPNGSNVFPAMEGEVITISRTRSKGKFITLLHDNGYETTYMHLKDYAPGLKVGMWVELDDKIGEVGRTGYSTGAHLHFGVIQEGYFINPLFLIKAYSYNQRGEHENKKSVAIVEEKNIIDGEVPEDEIDNDVQEL